MTKRNVETYRDGVLVSSIQVDVSDSIIYGSQPTESTRKGLLAFVANMIAKIRGK